MIWNHTLSRLMIEVPPKAVVKTPSYLLDR